MQKLTQSQARRFMLAKHGLTGERRFSGKDGIMRYIRSVGCVQFDPIDVCSRTADIALNSRVEGYEKTMLDELLYKDRLLFDYFDKNLCIIPAELWRYFAFERERSARSGRSREKVEAVRETLFSHIQTHGATCSADIKLSDEKTSWYWSGASLSRAALETYYFRGELGVHHKKGTVKYYDLVQRLFPPEVLAGEYPFANEDERDTWLVKRRIAAVGLMWERASDAFLCIKNLKKERRAALFSALERAGEIIPVETEGFAQPLYCAAEDAPLLAQADAQCPPRCELLAPLDCFLWDRRLIKALFGFEYTWEIYAPPQKRKYGYYVLPILYRDALVGRIEPVADRRQGVLEIRNVWFEQGFVPDGEFEKCLQEAKTRLARLNGCELR